MLKELLQMSESLSKTDFEKIEAEWDRLYSMKTKDLEKELGKKLSHVHLGKETDIQNYLKKKFGKKFDQYIEAEAKIFHSQK
jgi:hypothetical protein